MFSIGREHSKNKDFNIFFRLYFGIFGSPEIGAKIRTKWALRVIREYPFNSLLDAGCGRGYVSFQIAKYYPHVQVVGVDIDRKKVLSNRSIKKNFNLSNLCYEECSLLHLPSEKQYDIILLSDVLEHIEDDDKILKNLRSCIEESGKLIIHVPRSKQHYFFKKAAEYIVEDHVRPGYTENELSSKLQAAGFKVNKVISSYTFFESFANQIGNIFSNNLLIYSILLPVLTSLSHVPQKILKKEKHISNTMIIIAEPAI